MDSSSPLSCSFVHIHLPPHKQTIGSLEVTVMRMNLQDIYQGRELVLVVIKVGLILLGIKLWLIFVGV